MRILFVCMGNICRSPTAEGVFRRLVQERAPHLPIEIDSAGTHDYHVGEPPDSRSVAAAARRGIDLRSLRARQVSDEDFERLASTSAACARARSATKTSSAST